MKLTRMTGLVAVALAAAMSIAYAAGLFPGIPIVGGASYCTSFVVSPLTGAATTTCNSPQTPAGPSVLTGSELIPADTGLAQGQAPQTVLITPMSLNAAPIAFVSLASGATTTI